MLLKLKKEKRSSGLLQGEVMSWRAAWRGLAAALFLSGLVFADQIYFRAAGNNGVVTTALLLRSLGVGGFTLVIGLLVWSIIFTVSWRRTGNERQMRQTSVLEIPAARLLRLQDPSELATEDVPKENTVQHQRHL